MKDFNLICAVSLNGVIGNSETNSIPWYLPTDLKYFKSKTFNQTVIMGSNTYRSIGKPLKDRRNIVITRDKEAGLRMMDEEGIDEFYPSFREAYQVERDFFVIGGQHIYQEAMIKQPKRMLITIVKSEFEGDVRFPIDGIRFLRDEVVVSDKVKYACTKRSAWCTENGLEYQFTEFTMKD